MSNIVNRVNAARVKPENGMQVVGVLNRKGEFGRSLLRDVVPQAHEVYRALERGRIEFLPTGSSSYGTYLPVPNGFLAERNASMLLDIFTHNPLEDVQSALGNGWKAVDAGHYFSITFADGKGETHTVATMAGELIFSRNDGKGVHVAATSVPTEWYRANDGVVEVVTFTRIPSLGQTVLSKLLRGNPQDINDIVAVGSAIGLGKVLDDYSIGFFDRKIEGLARQGSGRIRTLKGRLGRVAAAMQGLADGTAKAVQDSVEVLQLLRDRVDTVLGKMTS